MFVTENLKFKLLLHHLLQNKKLGARVHLLPSSRSIHEKIKIMPLEIKKLVHAGIRAQVSSATTKGPNH